ncbi:SanA/YdcF family protein [Herbidospora daliensis]|uniref:SanA/YdcF family protein n=1 Tax=Herbidospora daliensis TaxID=295585 RepID=UPI0007835746|nr:ElyC/SanA/YdcF family protein [Herbidospora daliensis]
MKRAVFRGAVAASLAALAPMTWAWLSSDGLRVDTNDPRWTAGVPAAPVALVLGAGVVGDWPTAMLRDRLDIGVALYRAGKVRALLLSGTNHVKDYDEPTVMRDYLLAKGVPADALVLDYAGLDTWDSCVRAKKIFGASRVTVVTQTFHLPRAVTLCREAGLATFGVGDDSQRKYAMTTYVYAAREFFATGKAFLDSVVLKSDPTFLGPYETSLDTALAKRS